MFHLVNKPLRENRERYHSRPWDNTRSQTQEANGLSTMQTGGPLMRDTTFEILPMFGDLPDDNKTSSPIKTFSSLWLSHSNKLTLFPGPLVRFEGYWSVSHGLARRSLQPKGNRTDSPDSSNLLTITLKWENHHFPFSIQV